MKTGATNGHVKRLRVTVQFLLSILCALYLPLRIGLAIVFLSLGLAAICAVAWVVLRKRALRYVTFFLFSLAVFMLFWQMVLLGRYEFLSGKSLPFWLPCLIGAVAVAAIAVIWGRRAKVDIWSGIALAMISGVFAFGLLSGMAANMNYVYDTAEPVRYESVIYVKDRDMNRKSLDRYTFDLIVDGKKITLDVSREAYERYEVGDTFSFFKYQGAFHEPFYLAGS